MINMKVESLLEFMRKHGYAADLQSETSQVYTILKIEEKDCPLFLRIFDDGHLLQLLVFIPSLLVPNENFELKNSHEESNNPNSAPVIADVARLLHLLNKELDLPGFGMDEAAGVVFYRLMLPAPKMKIDEELLVAFLKTIEHVCKMFAHPIAAVSSGKMSLNEILKKAQTMKE